MRKSVDHGREHVTDTWAATTVGDYCQGKTVNTKQQREHKDTDRDNGSEKTKTRIRKKARQKTRQKQENKILHRKKSGPYETKPNS
jgi:hypothetical protein